MRGGASRGARRRRLRRPAESFLAAPRKPPEVPKLPDLRWAHADDARDVKLVGWDLVGSGAASPAVRLDTACCLRQGGDRGVACHAEAPCLRWEAAVEDEAAEAEAAEATPDALD